MSVDVIQTELVAPLMAGMPDGFASHAGGGWRLGRPASNQDGRVARDLLQAGVPFYSPQIRQTTVSALTGRTRQRVGPLFPGYLFCVVGVVPLPPTLRRFRVEAVSDQERLVLDLERLERVRLSGRSVSLEPKLVPGSVIRLRGGAWEGYEGVVVRERGRHRLVVQIHAIGRGVAIEVPAWRVELARTGRPSG